MTGNKVRRLDETLGVLGLFFAGELTDLDLIDGPFLSLTFGLFTFGRFIILTDRRILLLALHLNSRTDPLIKQSNELLATHLPTLLPFPEPHRASTSPLLLAPRSAPKN